MSTSVIDIIDQLEEVVTTGKRIPFSANIVVNEDTTLELIDRARLGLPEELVEARHTISDREDLLARAEQEAEQLVSGARKEAERIIQGAEERAVRLTADHPLLEAARRRSEEMVTLAEEKAASIRNEADDYARQVMQRLEEELVRVTATVRKGLDTLPVAGRKRRRG